MMRRRCSATPLRMQIDHTLSADKEPTHQPQLSTILQWVNEETGKRLEDLKNEAFSVKSICEKQADQIWRAGTEVRQLQMKNESLSAAQKEQRAEFAGEKKRMRDSDEERGKDQEDKFSKYKQMMEDDLAELKAEKNDLVNSVEALDKRITQSEIANTELKRQRDESIDVRRQLEDSIVELQKIVNYNKEAHAEEVRISEEKLRIITDAAKDCGDKESGYLETIRDMNAENQNLDGHNFELTKMMEAQIRTSMETLYRQNSERPEKRRRISGQTEMSVIMSPFVREQMLVQRRPSVLNVFEEHPPSSYSPYASPHHQQNQQPLIPRGPARQSRGGRSSNGGQSAPRRGSKLQ